MRDVRDLNQHVSVVLRKRHKSVQRQRFAKQIALVARAPELRKHIHPIYVQKGIIPQVAAGLGSAARLTLDTQE